MTSLLRYAFALCFCIFFARLALADATALQKAPASPALRLEQLLRSADQDFEVQIRITSRVSGSVPAVAHLTAVHEKVRTSQRVQFLVDANGVREEFCLACSNDLGVTACEDAPSSRVPDARQTLPGTSLPWEELIAGACSPWKIAARSDQGQASGEAPMLFDLRLAAPPANLTWSITVAQVDPVSGRPVQFDRLDDAGNLVRSVRILDVGTFAGREGIRRALVEQQGSSVLLEVRGIRYGAAIMNP